MSHVNPGASADLRRWDEPDGLLAPGQQRGHQSRQQPEAFGPRSVVRWQGAEVLDAARATPESEHYVTLRLRDVP